VQRVILGTAAYADPDFLQSACVRWPGRIAVDIAAKRGRAAVAGWTRETELLATDLARQCEARGAAMIIYTDILRDGAQTGVNLAAPGSWPGALRFP